MSSVHLDTENKTRGKEREKEISISINAFHKFIYIKDTYTHTHTHTSACASARVCFIESSVFLRLLQFRSKKWSFDRVDEVSSRKYTLDVSMREGWRDGRRQRADTSGGIRR